MNSREKGKNLLTVGRITGVHGLKGYMKVTSYAEAISIFKPGTMLDVVKSDGHRSWNEIVRSAPHKKGVLIQFKGVDVDGAGSFVGADLLIDRYGLPDLEEDAYYWQDLIGINVVDTNEGPMGKIKSVIATGSNDVFVISGGEREVLVPALASVVLSVDIENNEMRIDLPEGL